ncbi:RlpA-like double-psi beta-barrel domain-containing protein [Sporobolomyces salmoneus]|uniref:RlpA-like double-psi beta-barrel domain-containing protein n=1 Tax=Sporobolomyces salmoneus TaxID=183962 RepID=UPI00316B6F13
MKFSAVSVALGLLSVVSAAPVNSNEASSNLQKRGYSGQATWYTQGGAQGACGQYSSDSDYVVALQTSMYAGGSNCGKYVNIKNTNTGATTTAKVADQCPSCEGEGSIDLSKAAFSALGSTDQGVLPVSWSWA